MRHSRRLFSSLHQYMLHGSGRTCPSRHPSRSLISPMTSVRQRLAHLAAMCGAMLRCRSVRAYRAHGAVKWMHTSPPLVGPTGSPCGHAPTVHL
jgi:hypothetical protein